MKLLEQLEKTGKLPTYHLEELLNELVNAERTKPSSRIIQTKKGRKAIAGLTEIEQNHNHSWYKELKQRSKKHGNELALFYRGKKITFKEMFEHADMLAKSFAQSGIMQGDEIPVCISNTPELVYIMLAANKIGAKINLIGTNLDKEYLTTILDDCTNKLIIFTDDNYSIVSEEIKNRNYDNAVAISLADSLPLKPEQCDEYEPELDKYYRIPNKLHEIKENNYEIISFAEFIESGKKYEKEIIDNNNLDTEFLVTYTSGSTKTGHPKQIIHSNRSLITSGVFHDPELSGNPKIPGLRGLAHIHPDSNTNVITCIADNLMQIWSVALEPEYSKDKALEYVILNKPNYLNATTSFLIQMSKDYLIKRKFHKDGTGKKLPFLLAAFAVGEGTSKGEEKFINHFLRESKAGSGVKIKGLSLPYTTVSIGGGDCEHGGIYYTLWKTLQEQINSFRLKKGEYGLAQVPYAHISVFKKIDNGLYEECGYNEYGMIAANSATTMVRYKNNLEATKKLIIRDTTGRDWISSNVYGYIDNLGTVHVKGRVGNEIVLNDGTLIHPSTVEDIVSKDTKNILSCTITSSIDEDETIVPIVNVEFQPNKKKSDIGILYSIDGRIREKYPEFADSAVYRIFTNEESFPLTGSGKRSVQAIENMGLSNIIKLNTYNSKNKNDIKEQQKIIKKTS